MCDPNAEAGVGGRAPQCGRPLLRAVGVSGVAEGAARAMNHRSREPPDTGPAPHQ